MISEQELIAVLNSAPVVDGQITERLDDVRMRSVRDDLHAVIRGERAATALSPYLSRVVQTPHLTNDGLDWALQGPDSELPYAEVVLAWSQVERELPGRLRACANPDCNKFLIDHSKPNSAKWCSMATCGNRLKARRHAARLATD
jgi:predicted RNA-binding Zn ribbon-like protein